MARLVIISPAFFEVVSEFCPKSPRIRALPHCQRGTVRIQAEVESVVTACRSYLRRVKTILECSRAEVVKCDFSMELHSRYRLSCFIVRISLTRCRPRWLQQFVPRLQPRRPRQFRSPTRALQALRWKRQAQCPRSPTRARKRKQQGVLTSDSQSTWLSGARKQKRARRSRREGR